MPKEKKASNVWSLYKIEDNKVIVKNKSCPKCGNGVFLADHNDRYSCGKCGYTVFKNSKN